MVKPELTGQRDLTYSRWHRTLPRWCWMVDLDSIEWRSERGIVALIELARYEATVYKKKFQLKVLKELARQAKIPAYLVLYHNSMNLFEVYDLFSGETIFECNKKVLTENEYREFIKSL